MRVLAFLLAACALGIAAWLLPRARAAPMLEAALGIAGFTFVSEDLAGITAGVLAGSGTISLPLAIFATWLGIFLGDALTMLAGRWLGRPALERRPLRWLVSQQQLDAAAHWMAGREVHAIFLVRFIPGMRVATYFAAGVLTRRPVLVLLCLGLAAAVWTPLLVGASFLLGREAIDMFLAKYGWPAIAGMVFAFWWLMRGVRGLLTHEGRRAWVGRIKRLRHWEFWPMAVFYPPVLAKILALGLRHRNLLAFTACNPAMPASGIAGESKIEILRGLNDPHGQYVARAVLVRTPADVAHFLDGLGQSFPVVLKPDVGERGSGVTVAHSVREVEAHFASATVATIAQEYIPGHEFGVFYVRRPGDARGHIFAITDKRMPVLTGDGARSLRRLILDDARAVAMAGHYLKVNRAQAERVPAAGEQVQLVELGTHSKGCIFLDGYSCYCTPELEHAVEQVSRKYEGFYFGRYDVRSTTEDDFRAGKFKVIELNGVTSEATSIYDPANTVFDAWRVLFVQWTLAFDIGAANIRAGHRAASWAELIRIWRVYRRHAA